MKLRKLPFAIIKYTIIAIAALVGFVAEFASIGYVAGRMLAREILTNDVKNRASNKGVQDR